MHSYHYPSPYYSYQTPNPDFQAPVFVPQTPDQISSLNDAYMSYVALLQEHPGEKFIRYAKKQKNDSALKAKFGKTRKTSFNVIGLDNGSLASSYRLIDNKEKVLDVFLQIKDKIKANENLAKLRELPVISKNLDKAEIEEFNTDCGSRFRKVSFKRE